MTRRISEVLRGSASLGEALTLAASELRKVLQVPGVGLTVRRGGRTVRGTSGTLGDDAEAIPLHDGDIDGTLLVPPRDEGSSLTTSRWS